MSITAFILMLRQLRTIHMKFIFNMLCHKFSQNLKYTLYTAVFIIEFPPNLLIRFYSLLIQKAHFYIGR